jgi:hypothetical protein
MQEPSACKSPEALPCATLRKDLSSSQESKLKAHQPPAFQCPIDLPRNPSVQLGAREKKVRLRPPYPNKGVEFAAQLGYVL